MKKLSATNSGPCMLLLALSLLASLGCDDGRISKAELRERPVAQVPPRPGESAVPHPQKLRELIDETERTIDSADPDDAIEKYFYLFR